MSAIRNERGVGVAAAIFFVLILATLGTMTLTMVVEDFHGAVAHTDSEAALLAAQAGLDFGLSKIMADTTWGGLAAPGKPVGRGAFTVAVSTNDENSNPLAAGQRMVLATGTVGTAVRKLRRIVVAYAGGSATIFAQAEGDAVGILPAKKLVSIANIHDSASGPNNVWGNGGFGNSVNESGDFGTWTASGIPGPVLNVEAAIYGYVSGSLSNDYTDVAVYFNNAQQGGTFTLSPATLNTRIGSANKGYWYIDVTSVRSWSAADLTGDLELYLINQKVAGPDGVTLYLDAVGFRITTGPAWIPVASTFKEVVL